LVNLSKKAGGFIRIRGDPHDCFEELGVLMRAVVLGAKLGAPEIGVDVVLDKLLDQLLSFFSRVCKPLVCIPTNPHHAVPAFWR
jgi:hypothetical protein